MNGELQDIKSRKGTALLAYLAATGQRHSRDILATLLWPEHDQENARSNLRRTLYRLNQTVVGEWLQSDQEHVGLQVDQDGFIDVIEFTRRLKNDDLVSAVAAYGGDFLTGFYLDDNAEFEEWATQQRETYRRQVLDALHQLAEAAVGTGNLDAAIAYARRQLGIDPLREQALRQLMHVLTTAGKRNEALTAFEKSRQHLWSELGVEPEPETKSLYDLIVAGDLQPAMTATLPARRHHNLPVQTTPFIGREKELTQLTDLLIQSEIRLVTIAGPGGMGKTRLALAAGEYFVAMQQDGTTSVPFRDGIYFVDLAPVEHPDHILQALAKAADIRFRPGEGDQHRQILDHFHTRQVLLIMDNFDHLISGSGLVTEILQAAGGTKILVTSRHPLNQLGETRILLEGMDFPEWPAPEDGAAPGVEYGAVQLFVQSARRAVPGFSLTALQQRDVARICQIVEGMPLGIILAASWIEMLDPSAIAAEIQKSLDFLASDLTDLPERQRSIEAVFAYSWRQLTDEEQIALARLSVFAGGFTREAAEIVAVCDPRMLQALVRKSLVRREGDGRFHMHELLRQYAAGKLNVMADAFQTCERHGRYYANLAEKQYLLGDSLVSPDAVDVLTAEMDNVRRAWNHALDRQKPGLLEAIAPSLSVVYDLRGRNLDGLSLIEDAIRRVASFSPPAPAETVTILKQFEAWLWISHDVVKSRSRMLALVPAVEALSPGPRQLDLYDLLSMYSFMSNDNAEAQAWAQKGLQLALELHDVEAEALFRCSLLYAQVIEPAQARGLLDGVLQPLLANLEAQHPFALDLTWLCYFMARLYGSLEDPEIAARYYERGIDVARRWRHLFAESMGNSELIALYSRVGQQGQARRALQRIILDHMDYGQDWQLLGAIQYNTRLFPELVGGVRRSVAILSMVYHHPDTLVRYREEIDGTLPEFEQRLGRDAFAAAWASGKTMQLEAIVRGLLTGQQTSPGAAG